jgi:type 1 fimbria pilin
MEFKMQRLLGALALLVLTGVTTAAHAVDCRVNGGQWQNGNPNLQVPVTVTLSADRTRITLEGARLECRFTYSGGPGWHTDFWVSGSAAGTAWTPGPKFVNEGTGLRINGAFHNTPVPTGIAIAVIPNNGAFYPINVTPYILLRNYPSNPFDVRIGDNLGLLRLTSSNNYDGTRPRLTVTYTAANNFTVSPSTCTINNNAPIEIDFGNVHQRAIGTDPLTSDIVAHRRLTYSCPDGGINTPITITYKGSPSSFDARLLMMTHADVGTALVRAGSAVPVNGSFLTRITNSSGGDDVTFSLVRRTGSLPAAGPISGSGVLVMGVP